ncbi:dihydrolipoamide acetyltransferase family protein [Aequorivita sp. CIP111184]|uniref:dihydrolipoamide acetyltransferase family protein n=1 Tax=Aequorivita sp. CIP111184 TaxID=2211356 RepID=UPI000DBC17C0|nr:dihydrolipoamide acetyltransferase family protein [Aequorivita sp. CIP111184]SRX54568.1 Dihydrolipoyllysine-residue acetyltransferase component of pyruvate dehydrogenase complex [Aequorivita sp. CIP111184]
MSDEKRFLPAQEFKMPKMGESITEGTIINWMINEGDSFEEGDILLEVATDKVDNEVPAPASGKMLEHKFKAKDIVPVGEVIAILELSDEKGVSTSSKKTTEKNIVKDSSEKTKGQKQVSKPASFKVNENVFISPLVDAVARKNHISYEELARISGTGKDGRLRKSDVSNYLENGRPFQFVQNSREDGNPTFQIPDLKFDKGKGKIVEMDRMRQMIADHMVFSASTAPHVTAYVEADLTEMVNWRNKNKVAFQKKHNEKLTFTPLFIECVAKAITDFPMINSTLDGTNIIVKEEINIGMATALPSGNLIVPVVKNADKKDLKELAKTTNELVGKSRDNKLKGDDTKGSTFTISNVGTFGSLMGTPIINQPEAAILATGIIKKRAEVMEREEGDTIEIRQMMYLSLSFDHRIVDGYLAGSFLRRIANYMEKFDVERTF